MTTTRKNMKTMIKLAIAVALVMLNAEVRFAAAAEESAVTLKVSESSLNAMPDKYVDDLCKAATVMWATVPSKENAEALATICAVSVNRHRAQH